MKIEWNSKYKTISVYTVITATIITVIVLFFLNLSFFGNAVTALFAILLPFVIGFAVAYLLSRPAAYIERRWFAFLELKHPHPAIRRGLSILTLFIAVFGIFILLVSFIIPQLFDSTTTLLRNIPYYLVQIEHTIISWLRSIDLYTPDILEQIQIFKDSFLNITTYVNQLVSQLPSFISSVGTGIFNFFVGMIVCVYVLFSKERFVRQAKKLTYAVLKKDFAQKFIDVLKYSNNVFLGFIMGMLASTAFVGVCTFFFMTICGMPYVMPITVIIAITNIIPFFGPFLGAIPSIILLLIVDPVYAIAFLIFILILQQIDGNIILPKLIGMNIGMSAFWVLFALLMGGGLFGFWGLVLGIPVFAVLYSLAKTLIDNTLQKKGVPPKQYLYPEDKIRYSPGKTFHTKNRTKKKTQDKS